MSYLNDSTWKITQEFLPINNRLNENNLPIESFININNFKIHLDSYKSKNPKARIIIFHGVGGNGRLLSFISVPLNKAGYEIICPDMPLYGLTKYSGTISYDDWINCGLSLVNAFNNDNIPTFLFGLSAGGMLVYQIACESSNIKGIITTCLLDQRNPKVTKATASSPLVATFGKSFLNISHNIFGFLKLPMKLVCNMKAIVNNEDLAEILMKDKLSSGSYVSLKFLHGMLNLKIKIEPENFNKCPILLAHPENDKWTDISFSKNFFNKIKSKKSIVILKNAGHFPIEKEGLEILEKSILEFIENNK